jgi:hypothetical protein
MQLNNVNLKSSTVSNVVTKFNKKYQYQTDSTAFRNNVNFSKNDTNIMMTKYDGTTQSGLSYFSILNAKNGSSLINKISSQGIKIYSNIAATDNSGFYLVGNTALDGNNTYDTLVTKLDNNGNELWKYSYKQTTLSASQLNICDLDSTGNLIAAGTATGNTQLSLFFIKFNSSGATQLAKVINTTSPQRVISLKIDTSNNYVYFISQSNNAANDLTFGCLDNNFDVVWLKTLTTTGIERIRPVSAFNTTSSNTSIDFNGSSVFVTFTTNDTTLVGAGLHKPIIIEFNKTNGNIIKSQYVNSRHDYTYLKFENGLMKFFGVVLTSVPANFQFVSTISNWNTSPSYSGYYYNQYTASTTFDIKDGYIFGTSDYPTIIKTNTTDYNYNGTTPITNNFSNVTITLSDETYTTNNVTSSYNTPIAPTYTWNNIGLTIT